MIVPDLKGDTKESMVRPGERFGETEAARGHSTGVYGKTEEERHKASSPGSKVKINRDDVVRRFMVFKEGLVSCLDWLRWRHTHTDTHTHAYERDRDRESQAA